jgi:hypothetical protein
MTGSRGLVLAIAGGSVTFATMGLLTVFAPATDAAAPCPVGQVIGARLVCEPIFTPGDGLPPVAAVTPVCQPGRVLSGLLCVPDRSVAPPVAAPPPVVATPPRSAPVVIAPRRVAPVRRPEPVVVPRPAAPVVAAPRPEPAPAPLPAPVVEPEPVPLPEPVTEPTPVTDPDCPNRPIGVTVTAEVVISPS